MYTGDHDVPKDAIIERVKVRMSFSNQIPNKSQIRQLLIQLILEPIQYPTARSDGPIPLPFQEKLGSGLEMARLYAFGTVSGLNSPGLGCLFPDGTRHLY